MKTDRLPFLARSSRTLNAGTLFVVMVMASAVACHKSVVEQSRDVEVNAPAAGTVRRVLVSEGAEVNKDAVILEIAVKSEGASKPDSISEEQSRALRQAKTDLAASADEARRTAADVSRIEPLLRRGLASKAELDKARALALDASHRLEIAKAKVTTGEADKKQSPSSAASEQIVSVRMPASGILRALNVQEGQEVVAGQQVATVVSQT